MTDENLMFGWNHQNVIIYKGVYMSMKSVPTSLAYIALCNNTAISMCYSRTFSELEHFEKNLEWNWVGLFKQSLGDEIGAGIWENINLPNLFSSLWKSINRRFDTSEGVFYIIVVEENFESAGCARNYENEAANISTGIFLKTLFNNFAKKFSSNLCWWVKRSHRGALLYLFETKKVDIRVFMVWKKEN